MRPFVALNAASSIDGKITTADRLLHGFGGPEDRDLMDELRAEADAVIIGAATLREEDPLLIVRSPERIARRREAGRPEQPTSVVVSRSLDFRVEGSRFFGTPGFARIVVCGDDAAPEHLARLRDVAEVVPVPTGPGGLDLSRALEQLAARGVRHLLLEGGGLLNFAMIEAGLVDRIHLTLCPFVFGGDAAPTTFGGAGLSSTALRALALDSVRQGGDGRLFLTYRTGP